MGLKIGDGVVYRGFALPGQVLAARWGLLDWRPSIGPKAGCGLG